MKWPEDCFITYSCRISSFEEIGINVNVWIQKPGVVSNNSVNINFSQKLLQTKSLAREMIINLPLLLILVGYNSFEDIERNVPVRIQIPRVVSNNSVNINFRKKCARDQKFGLWNDHKLTSITYSCRVNSFEDIVRNVPVRIKKPRVVSNNSVNINFIQKVLETKSFTCEMTRRLLHYIFL